MRRRTRTPVLIAAVVTLVVAAVVGGIALQLLSGGIRVRSLSPAVLAVALGVLGALVTVQRPGLRLGPLLVANGVAFGLGTLAAGALDYGAGHGIARALADVAFAAVQLTLVMNAAWTLFILWFPDDRFASERWRRFFAFAAVAILGLALAGWLAGPSGHVNGFYAGTDVPHGVGGPFAGTVKPLGAIAALTLLFPLVGLASIVQRRRRASVVVRQQIRWLFAALAVDIVVQVASVPFAGRAGWPGAVASAFGLVATPLPVIAAAVAILRYRLWDIQLVVSRALVYGVLWVALSALLLVPGLAAGLLVGGRDAAVAVTLALVVTVVFHPARTRLERFAERLVYRHRTPPYVLLTAFWETLRTRDLERLGAPLAAAVRDGLAVEWAGVWLHAEADGDGRVMRPLGVAGAAPRAPVTLPRGVAERLRASPGLVLPDAPPQPLPALWPGAPAAVVPLVAADELVGLLACGERPRDPLAARDFELLELVARDCAMRLRNLRLEADLRERLVQIEAQASALRRSRRRLVSAQDEERRRIERNLHDGVQQQLVALAVRLRQAAGGDALLADLANEAEQAIFALQDLARGIFPGVLVDQGLAAALRTQAARMPLTVRVEVDAAIAGTRLDPELEAALYFVALEALTNVQKHAPAAAPAVSLSAERDEVVLEVVDDGPGFERRAAAGSGLQNMEDRMAAVGGGVTIDSRPGAGTRIRASAPRRASAGPGLAQVDQHRGDAAVELGLRGQA